MGEAIAALDGNALYRKEFGDGFVDYFLMMKRAELGRYVAATAEVAGETEASAARDEWQMREYFEFF
jgi:glutamine synthetase